MIIGLGTTTLIATIAVIRSDWKAISDKASFRAHKAAIEQDKDIDSLDYALLSNEGKEETLVIN
jgi:hypothetical protein